MANCVRDMITQFTWVELMVDKLSLSCCRTPQPPPMRSDVQFSSRALEHKEMASNLATRAWCCSDTICAAEPVISVNVSTCKQSRKSRTRTTEGNRQLSCWQQWSGKKVQSWLMNTPMATSCYWFRHMPQELLTILPHFMYIPAVTFCLWSIRSNEDNTASPMAAGKSAGSRNETQCCRTQLCGDEHVHYAQS